ncbi:MAG: hypothetical protein WDN49_25160 [Acetobacteraceae bacterium]
MEAQIHPPQDPKTAIAGMAWRAGPAARSVQPSPPPRGRRTAPQFVVTAEGGGKAGSGRAGTKQAAERAAAAELLGRLMP